MTHTEKQMVARLLKALAMEDAMPGKDAPRNETRLAIADLLPLVRGYDTYATDKDGRRM
jgi:hypothetical protein